MKLFLKIFIPLLVMAAVGNGIYYWQVQKPNQLLEQNSSNNSLEDYYNAAKNLGKKVNQNSEISFLAVGDIMLSRGVAQRMAAAGNDGFLPFRNLDDLLTSTDFNFGNLESPFSGTNEQDKDPMTFKFNTPTWAMKGLSQYNFKILSLANNHILNQGPEGLLFTNKYLAENYQKGVGAGANLDEAWQGEVINEKGVRVGFLAATYAPNSSYIANINQLERLKISIASLKTESDFIVVSMHAGEEYVREPNASQTKFARAAIDAGADMVIGSHPHWVQPIEKYNGKYIFYSLGNFVFDQSWSIDTTQGLTAKITLNKAGLCTPGPGMNAACSSDVQGTNPGATLKRVELIPVVIENYSTPRLATELEKKEILNKIGLSSNLLVP